MAEIKETRVHDMWQTLSLFY